MNKVLRLVLILSPILILGLAIYDMQRPWQPPIDPNTPQHISIGVLLAHRDVYKAPMEVIINGDVYNKSLSGEFLFLYGGSNGYFEVNCSQIDISIIDGGMHVYIRGISYYDDPTKEYFLAEEIYRHESYSYYLSVPGLFLILIILFISFKFSLDDFSFSRRMRGVPEDS